MKIIKFFPVFAVLIFSFSSEGAEEKASGPYSLSLEEGRVTIRAEDAALEEILRDLARRAGFELFVYRPLEKRVTVDIRDLPVEEALRKLLPGHGFVFRRSPGGGAVLRAVAVLEGESADGYTRKTVARLGYGAGPGEIGRINVPGTERQGPRSFAVDRDGKIYVCDTVNRKVSIFGPDGELIRTLAGIGLPTDIAVADSGDIYILDEEGGRIVHYRSSGSRGEDLAISPGLLGRTQSLETVGETLLLRTRDGRDYELAPPTPDSDGEVKISGPLPGARIDSRLFCRVRKVSAEAAEVEMVGPGGEAVDLIPVPVERLASIAILGRDREGSLFLQVEQFRPEGPGVDLGVVRLNPGGIVLEKIEGIPAEYTSWTARLLQVDGNGDIIQMLPGPEAVELNRWSRNGAGMDTAAPPVE
ncbi:MAG: hypothetical protein P9M08_03270 [Candidatus Erginobacter occultus]|nr:hypothetical protein [Candidatus Erginobacter occultus]